MARSIFEQIASGEIKSHTIWQSDNYTAFLDINPLNPGHTLVIPKKNLGDQLFELNTNDYLDLLKAARTVAKLLKSKLQTDRVLMIVEGFEVPHVHIHLVPANANQPLSSLKKSQASQQELIKIKKLITSPKT